MDIHRSRFVPFPPSAINALAFSHPCNYGSEADPESLRLAVGRANGNIEIWSPANGLWIQEKILSGGKDRSVEGLVWTQEPDEENEPGHKLPGRSRLFSIGYSNSVTEWDLIAGLPARHSSGNHSEIWCVAAQPQRDEGRPTKKRKVSQIVVEDTSSQSLVTGCADGSLVLLATADGDLRFDKFLSRPTTKKARVLSVAYQDRSTVVAGFADSTIRVFDTVVGEIIRNISLGAGPIGGPSEILVWRVKCLPNGDIISGDSTGDIRFYDGKNYSQVQRISGHEADILDVAVSQDGRLIFSGGMDRRTTSYTSYKRIGAGGQGSGITSWRKHLHKRYHDHDVKAMATYEGKSMSVLVSGGIDTQLVVLPIRNFGSQNSRTLPALPPTPPLISAPSERLMVSWWNCEIRLWRVKKESEGVEKPKVIGRMAVSGDENIISASISKDSRLLVAATAAELKIFQLTPPKSTETDKLRIRKLEAPSVRSPRIVQFSNDGKWLAIINHTNEVLLARISMDSTGRLGLLPQLLKLRRIPRPSKQHNSLNGSWGNYYRTITHVEFSKDSDVLATADLAGYLDTWVIEGHEDFTAPAVDIGDVSTSSASSEDEDTDLEPHASQRPITIMGQRWIRNPSGHLLPRIDSSPLLLSFRPVLSHHRRALPNGNPAVHPTRNNPHPHSHELPEMEQSLVVVSAQHQLYEFDILSGRLSEWYRRNPSANLPSEFRRIKDRVKGCLWDVRQGSDRLWLYGESWLFMFDLSQDFPLPQSPPFSDPLNGVIADENRFPKKRKRESAQEKRKQPNSGAGDAMPESEMPATKVRKYEGSKSDAAAWININEGLSPESDEALDDKRFVLANLRRKDDDEGDSNAADVHSTDRVQNEDQVQKRSGQAKQEVGFRRDGSSDNWWNTYKYRPILGIVPLGDWNQPLEVVLVERPPWELDLPPRFVGSHEREE